MKIHHGTYLATIGAVICAIILGIIATLLWQRYKVFHDVKSIPSNISGITTRFLIYGIGESTLSARIWFYNQDGKEIGVIERSWNGWEFFFDFVILNLHDKHIVFPYKIYTNEIAGQYGTDCFSKYDNNRMPSIYDSVKLSQEERNIFSNIFSYVKLLVSIPFFPNSHIKYSTKQLRNPIIGQIYAVYSDYSGKIVIIPE